MRIRDGDDEIVVEDEKGCPMAQFLYRGGAGNIPTRNDALMLAELFIDTVLEMRRGEGFRLSLQGKDK